MFGWVCVDSQSTRECVDKVNTSLQYVSTLVSNMFPKGFQTSLKEGFQNVSKHVFHKADQGQINGPPRADQAQTNRGPSADKALTKGRPSPDQGQTEGKPRAILSRSNTTLLYNIILFDLKANHLGILGYWYADSII